MWYTLNVATEPTILEPNPRAYFHGGTLVLEDVGRAAQPPRCFEWIKGKWRCPAVYYRLVQPWLAEQGIKNGVPRWNKLSAVLADGRVPHPYQTEALRAWLAAERWGSVVLPTGAGKTFLALHAIAACGVSTLVVVPTVDLLHQWYARLDNAFGGPVGVWYGQEKRLEPLTVTTYPSAWANAELFGDKFKLLIFDEIHHLPAPSWHEIALMCAAPFRLGLTATYPEKRAAGSKPAPAAPQPGLFDDSPAADPAGLLAELVGPVVYRKQIDELTGAQLAEYRTERIRIDLTPEERARYDAAYGIYTGYVREARLRESHGPGWWHEMTRQSAYRAEARRAKVAELVVKEIVYRAQGKLAALDHLLREHRAEQLLVFTADNHFAYTIARRHLIPAITHQTGAAERKSILEQFQQGAYRAIVTSKVLNEGIDVPEAKVAVVLGGSSSAREYIQRLGRILRKRGNAQAVLYEVIARKTVDEGMAQRRKPRKEG